MADANLADQDGLEDFKKLFVGTWKEIDSEYVDEFFIELGVNYLLRKMAAAVRPEMIISVEGEEIRIEMRVPFKSQVSVLQIDKEMEIENDQGKFLATTRYENHRLFVVASPAPGNDSKEVTTMREINADGELVGTFTVGHVVSKRIFVRVE